MTQISRGCSKTMWPRDWMSRHVIACVIFQVICKHRVLYVAVLYKNYRIGCHKILVQNHWCMTELTTSLDRDKNSVTGELTTHTLWLADQSSRPTPIIIMLFPKSSRCLFQTGGGILRWIYRRKRDWWNQVSILIICLTHSGASCKKLSPPRNGFQPVISLLHNPVNLIPAPPT